jgi:phosphoglycolate phosphatase-like HAD superfamily hydrolase
MRENVIGSGRVQSHHIVWDWNGTLLDDLPVVVDSLNVGIGRYGMSPIDEEGYRDHFTRPVRAFYDSLFGRLVTDMEWRELNKVFHDEYSARVREASLTMDALHALARVDALGWSQSLLSMSPHTDLLQWVSERGVTDRFVAIDGLHSETGGLKAQHMEEHVDPLSVDASDVVVIGDTPDDAIAAWHVGAKVVLYDGGSHHIPALEAMDAPVAHSLVEAVEIAEQLSRGASV